MTDNHEIIHLNNRKRSKSPHFRNQENSMRDSIPISNNCRSPRLIETPSHIFGLNQFNDSNYIHQYRLDTNRSSSIRKNANTKRSNNYQINVLTNSPLFKSEYSNSVRIDTLQSQQNRFSLKKELDNNNSFIGIDHPQQFSKSQFYKNQKNIERTPQKISRRVTPRQSSKSPQKLHLAKNMVNVNQLDFLKKSQIKNSSLINITNLQNTMPNNFQTNFSHNSRNQLKHNNWIANSPTATTLQNSKSNIHIVSSQTPEKNQKSLAYSTSQGFFKNSAAQDFQNVKIRTSPGFKTSISPCKYQHPQQLIKIISPQRTNEKFSNQNLNQSYHSPQNIERKVSSSSIYKKTFQCSGNGSQILMDENKNSYVISSISDRQRELIRKNKVLQNRVGQLHNQKQNAALQLKEENHKLMNQNGQLKQQLMRCQRQLQKCRIQLQRSLQTINQNNRMSSFEFSKQLHQRQLSTDQVQQKISQLDPNQSQYQFTNINVGGQVIGIANLSRHSRQNPSLAEDYQQKIQQLTDNLQTEKAINLNLNQQIKQLKLFSFTNLSETQIQKQSKNTIHYLYTKNQLTNNLQKDINIKSQLQNLKNISAQDSKNVQINIKTIISQYQKQIINLKKKIQELQSYKIKKKNQIQNSCYVRNSGTSYSNLHSTENSTSKMADQSKSPTQKSNINTNNYSSQIDKAGEDDYQQIENLNKILDKMTYLEQKNNQLQSLATNLTIERDHLLKTIDSYEQKIRCLQDCQEKLKLALNETLCKSTETIRMLNRQKQQYQITIKNYAQQLNQLRCLYEKYSQKGLPLSSSRVQTQNGSKLNNISYGGSHCKKCEDLMKTISKLNSHLNSRK